MTTKKLYPLKPRIKICDDFFVADTETGKRTQLKNGVTKIDWQLQATQDKFIFGAVYGKNFSKVFHTLKEMQNEFLQPRYKDKIVFFHNFGKYDSSVLFDNIFTLDPESVFIGSRFITCTNGNCSFGDSLNIYKASVKEIGKKLGKEKLGMNDGNYETSFWPQDKARDINGCLRDCEIIYDALFEMFEEVGDIKLTIGSCAMSYFRRNAQRYIIEANENVKYFWESYYGGRTEAFKLGKTHAKVIDVNSLYPDRMKNIKYPNPKFLKHETNISVTYFKNKILPFYEGCANVVVEHPNFWLGLLPSKCDGKLKFRGGTFQGVYNFNELKFAIEYGVKVLQINWITYSEPMESPFINFVDDLSFKKIEAKLTGQDLNEWKYKYLLNNLYGKFGQRIKEKTIYIKDVIDQFDLINDYKRKDKFLRLIPFNKNRSDAFLIIKPDKFIEPKYSMPSFASYITSAGRVKLGETLIKMKINKPVYCDTDSIFFEIDTGIKSSDILGEWKIENKIVTEIRGLKNYSYISNGKEYERIKGVPSKAKKIDNNKYEYFSLVGTKEGLRRKIEIGTQQKRQKIISGKYDKRIVLPNGETKLIII